MPIPLCARCRREITPQPAQQPRIDLLFLESGGTNDDMVSDAKPDVETEKAKRKRERRERGRIIRELIQSGDILGAQRFAFTTIALPSQSEECPDCLAIKARVA